MKHVIATAVVGAVSVVGLGLVGGGHAAGSPAATDASLSQHYTSSTTTALVSNRNPARVEEFVVPIATVSSPDGTPRGTVDFFDGARTVCADVPLDGAGIATCAVHLTPDVHPLTAIFTGNADFGPSASLPLAQVVRRS
jgi:hypothetical protein